MVLPSDSSRGKLTQSGSLEHVADCVASLPRLAKWSSRVCAGYVDSYSGMFRRNPTVVDFDSLIAYVFNVHKREIDMPRAAVGDNNRLALRVRPGDKATIMRAAALAETDMTNFILRTVLREARSVIEEHERIRLSDRDTRLVLELLENPPAPNSKLRKAARALTRRS